MASQYKTFYQSWQNDSQAFWAKASEPMRWYQKPSKTFDANQGVYGQWFVGGTTNICHNCLDRHVLDGRSQQPALIYDSPVTGAKKTITYGALLDQVQFFAAALAELGIGQGDRVLIYMPMIPETVVGMLACARLGAVHSVVFGGFASKELATRIDDCTPKLILAASCGIEGSKVIPYKPLLDEAISISRNRPGNCVIFQRPECKADLWANRDRDWVELVDALDPNTTRQACVPVKATDPLYVLYTSGTTGVPKGVVRDHGGHQVALNWSMNNIYGVEPGEVFWAASDVGWVVGHSYIVYAPLLFGCTTIVFEGKPVGTPDAGTFWRVISEHKVSAFFTAPTALRAIKKEDPEGVFTKDYDLSGLRTLFLAGERADPDTIHWAEGLLKIPVIDHWWQTETGWTICGNPIGLGQMPVKYGSAGVPMPGYDVVVVDDECKEVSAGELGNIVIRLPLPPGCLPTLWEQDEKFRDSYLKDFPGYYKTADAGFKDEDGYVFIMARTDDIINVAGHRLSTGGMEEVVASHPDVAECAVLGVKDALKGEMPWGFVVLKSGVKKDSNIIARECVKLVREKIGPVAAFRTAVVVERLPKTRSGKILRNTMRKICNDEEWTTPATIDDPEILTEISAKVADKIGNP